MRRDGLGLEVRGQRIEPDRAVLACRIAGEDRWCRRCGCQGCTHVWCQDVSAAAEPRAKLSRAAVRWVLTGVVVQHLTVARIAQAVGVSWNTAHTAVLGEGQRLLINDPTRFDGVRISGVDEHVWRHTPHQDRYVTVILDVTPIRDRSGPSRLLEMVVAAPSRSLGSGWPPGPPPGVSALRSLRWMDSLVSRALPHPHQPRRQIPHRIRTTPSGLDNSRINKPSTTCAQAHALDECRRRIGQERHHRRGRATDTLSKARRMLAHPILPAHAWSAVPDTRSVCQRGARRNQGYLERLAGCHLAPKACPTRARAKS